MFKFFRWVRNLFQIKRIPIYRIYGTRWKIVSLGKDNWDIADEKDFPTLFVSDKAGILMWKKQELYKFYNEQEDGYCYNFHVDTNREPDKKGIWV